MQLKNPISLLFMIMIVMFSCKKSEVKNDADNNTANLAEEFKGSVWAGEFRYTTGAYQGLQPFSAMLNSDGTLTWSDIENTRAGGRWGIEGNKINLKFPNGSTNSADVTKDGWSNFSNPSVNGFEIANITRSEVPTEKLLMSSHWTGSLKLRETGQISDANFDFLPGNTNEFTIDRGPKYNNQYSIEGAGIRFVTGGYLVFFNNPFALKGFDRDNFLYYWELKK